MIAKVGNSATAMRKKLAATDKTDPTAWSHHIWADVTAV